MASPGYRWCVAGGLLLVCALGYCFAYAMELPEAPALADVKATAAQGCALSFEASVGGKTVTDARQARLVALYVPEGTPPTPFLPAGPFKATFVTDLALRLRDDVTFSIVGAGAVRMSVNGTAVVEGDLLEKSALAGKPASLKKGKNRIVLEYASPPRGDAFVRLYWATSDFLPEPVPPQVLSHDASATDVRAGMRVREGRMLFGTLHCGKCHGGDELDAAAVGGDEAPAWQPTHMPELEADAPSLAEAGARLNESWMARWISDPRAMRHDATMPRVFRAAAGGVAAEARDIAAYLATLGRIDVAEGEEPAEEVVEAGGRIFAHLRCIACHTLPEHQDAESVRGRTPLHHVAAKYRAGALAAFLKAPERHYAWTRMPNFRLSDKEAESLAAFLMSRERKAAGAEAAVRGDAGKGKDLLVSSGCLNCHLGSDGLKSTLRAPRIGEIAKAGWTRGCVAEGDGARGEGPDFGMTLEQREAIVAFAATDRSSLKREALGEFAERQVGALNCVACHPRDDREDLYAGFEDETAALAPGGVWEGDQGEGGERLSPDQTTPMLTWAGEKLKPEWTAKLIGGKLGYELRPWLRARMPGFASRAADMARGLAMQHGFSPAAEAHDEADVELARNGMKLSGAAGGFQCVACHGIGEMEATSVFEAPGMNFKYVERRLRKHYYDRWVIAPMRIHKETKMPAFADQEGKTSIGEIYEGDARKQYDAIWHYLLAGEKIRPPEN